MKKKVLIGVHIECETPDYLLWHRSIEKQARAMERWAKEFQEFIRDHRSQDPVQISVIREYQDQCSFCGYEWEMDEQGPVCCDKAQAEWDKEQAA